MVSPDRRSEGMQAFDLGDEAALEEWTFQQCKWTHPLSLKHDLPTSDFLSDKGAILLLTQRPPESALVCAARNCFWDMPMHAVRRLAKWKVLGYANTSDSEVLTMLVKFALPEITPEELLDILLKRAPQAIRSGGDLDE